MHLQEIADNHCAWLDTMDFRETSVLEALALIASEIGEAVNECRGDTPTDLLGRELADIILRTMHTAKKEGINIEDEIHRKMTINRVVGSKDRKV